MLGKKYDVVVNIQGDEPLIEPDIIDGVVKALQVSFCFLLFGLLPSEKCTHRATCKWEILGSIKVLESFVS